MGGKGSGAKKCKPNCDCHRHRQICMPDCKCKKHRKAEEHPNWIDNPGYQAIHRRLREYRGSAAKQICVDCNGQAKHWTQIHNTPGKDVYNDFEPRCASCHVKYDNNTQWGRIYGI